MYVCICNSVTDSDIRIAVDEGVRNMAQLKRKTACASTCGNCREEAREILQLALAEKRHVPDVLPVFQIA